MNLSYWEYKSWLSNVDFTVVGSGIVGLSCALSLRERFPDARILVLEKGTLPQGASTKNAGFACYGSLSEILSDLKVHSEEEVRELVQMRWEGIQLLRHRFGDEAIGFEQHGGHELFLTGESDKYDRCLTEMDRVNKILEPVFNKAAFRRTSNSFHFENIVDHYISNPLEGQLDTGKLMQTLLKKVRQSGIEILNAVTVKSFSQLTDQVSVETQLFEFKTGQLFIATNGFVTQLVEESVKPARAQVLITGPIPGLPIQGTFHMDAGYYYFRNIDDRILLGGARNLDIAGETTTKFGVTDVIQTKLETMLSEIILPNTPWEIEQRWSGIMGVGQQKKPILKELSNNVFCGVRLGGMGIAIGSLIGKSLAEFAD